MMRGMLQALTAQSAAILVLWVALLALTSIVARELGLACLKRYRWTVALLAVALAGLPAAAVMKAARPYRNRLAAILLRKQSPPIVLSSGCRIFPANNIWNTRVDGLPVDPNSNAYIDLMGPDLPLHGDFGASAGIPYTVTGGRGVRADVVFTQTPAESDPGPYVIPESARVEDGSDGHVLVLDTERCRLYELFGAEKTGGRSWNAKSGATFDLASNGLRPAGWTSADAAGLPILPGLIRYDEAVSGRIAHALRFTARVTRKSYVWPARHRASYHDSAKLPPMGQRFRLRSSFDASGFSPEARAIVAALQEYGMMLADNGGPWFVSGTPDTRWTSRLHEELQRISGADFEAVDAAAFQVDANSGEARAGSR
jgi:hypothetical protein